MQDDVNYNILLYLYIVEKMMEADWRLEDAKQMWRFEDIKMHNVNQLMSKSNLAMSINVNGGIMCRGWDAEEATEKAPEIS